MASAPANLSTPPRGGPAPAAPRRGLWLAWLGLALFAAPLAIIAAKALWDPALKFLPPSPRAAWAFFHDPGAGDFWRQLRQRPNVVRYEAPFAAADLGQEPVLVVRGFTALRVELNGQELAPAEAGTNWKAASRYQLAPALRPDANTLRITVSDPGAMPALLIEQPPALRTPGPWQASRGPAFAQAHPVVTPDRIPPDPGPLQRLSAWGLLRWAILAWIALVGIAAARVWWKTRRPPPTRAPPPPAPAPRRGGRTLVALVVLLAGLLNLWNAWHYDWWRGPDARGHAQHIQQVARTWRPALAPDGWQAYQPPLYYFTAAGVYQFAGGDAHPDRAFRAVQVLGALAGVAMLGVVAALLRRLAPDTAPAPALALAALAPVALCVNPLINSEAFAALVIASAALGLVGALRRVPEQTLTVGRALTVGGLVGLAMLAKFSGLLLLLTGLVVLLPWTLRRARSAQGWLALAAFVVGALAVCGWYYARNAVLFGDPFYGNWRVWTFDQVPTFRWAGYYLRFGASFFGHPDAGQWWSWLDGLYASFFTGERMFYFSDWMTQALLLLQLILLLGLPLAATMLVGLLRTVAGVWREPTSANSAGDTVLLGLTALTLLSLVWFSIRIPAEGAVTARYALYLLPALAVFFARGRAAAQHASPWLRRALDLDLGLLCLLVLLVYRFGAFRQ